MKNFKQAARSIMKSAVLGGSRLSTMATSQSNAHDMSAPDNTDKKRKRDGLARLKKKGQAYIKAIKDCHRQAAPSQHDATSKPSPDQVQNAAVSTGDSHTTSTAEVSAAHIEPPDSDDKITAAKSAGIQNPDLTEHSGNVEYGKTETDNHINKLNVISTASSSTQTLNDVDEASANGPKSIQSDVSQQMELDEAQSVIEDLEAQLAAEEVTTSYLTKHHKKKIDGMTFLIRTVYSKLITEVSEHEETTRAATYLQKERGSLQEQVKVLQQEVEYSRKRAEAHNELRNEYEALNQHVEKIEKHSRIMEKKLNASNYRVTMLEAEVEEHRHQAEMHDKQAVKITDFSDSSNVTTFEETAADLRMVLYDNGWEEMQSLFEQKMILVQEKKFLVKENMSLAKENMSLVEEKESLNEMRKSDKEKMLRERHNILKEFGEAKRQIARIEQSRMTNEGLENVQEQDETTYKRLAQLTAEAAENRKNEAARIAKVESELKAVVIERDAAVAENQDLHRTLSQALNDCYLNQDDFWRWTRDASEKLAKKMVKMRQEKTKLLIEIANEKQGKLEALHLIERLQTEKTEMAQKTDGIEDQNNDIAMMKKELVDARALAELSQGLQTRLNHTTTELDIQVAKTHELENKFFRTKVELNCVLKELHNRRKEDELLDQRYQMTKDLIVGYFQQYGSNNIDGPFINLMNVQELLEAQKVYRDLFLQATQIQNEYETYQMEVALWINSNTSAGFGAFMNRDGSDINHGRATSSSTASSGEDDEEKVDRF